MLYGVSQTGGASNCGYIYRLTTKGSHFSNIYSFDCSAGGAYPSDVLTEGPDGALYGTAALRGINNYGVLFRLALSGEVSILHSFNQTDGAGPSAAPVFAKDGTMYGTCGGGGASGTGTVWKMDSGGNFAVIYSFEFRNQANLGDPQYRLTLGSDGWLYGVAEYGGTANIAGGVYRNSTSGEYEPLRVFDFTTDGRSPTGSPVEGTHGTFLGTNSAINSGGGTIWALEKP
jgi:uncharacterized repeat protein (TIGR03803 family)